MQKFHPESAAACGRSWMVEKEWPDWRLYSTDILGDSRSNGSKMLRSNWIEKERQECKLDRRLNENKVPVLEASA